ncbi:MAG: hypothetical protein WAU77_08060 [Solirubrobacteraceae bacterium]
MSPEKLRVVDDVSPAEWIAPRLSGRFGAVGLTVPRGYQAYARICHPATNKAGEPVGWSDVAEATGRRPHALMQWHAIVGSPDYLNMRGSLWDGSNPCRGALAHSALSVLCDRLAGDPQNEPDCYFCLWEGYGGLETYGWLETTLAPYSKVAVQDRHIFTSEEIARPRLHLPDRDYVVLAGPSRSASRIGSFAAEHFWPQSPNLFWSADQAWCVASEIDFDSTLVGGPLRLVETRSSTHQSWTRGPSQLMTRSRATPTRSTKSSRAYPPLGDSPSSGFALG